MSGHISSPYVEAPRDAWWHWRSGLALAKTYPEFANKHFFNPILNDPEAPKILKDMVVKQQEKIASDAKRPAPFVQRADSDYVPF